MGRVGLGWGWAGPGGLWSIVLTPVKNQRLGWGWGGGSQALFLDRNELNCLTRIGAWEHFLC